MRNMEHQAHFHTLFLCAPAGLASVDFDVWALVSHKAALSLVAKGANIGVPRKNFFIPAIII